MNQTLSEIVVEYRPLRNQGPSIKGSAQAFEIFKLLFDLNTIALKEESLCLYLNRANKLNGWYRVSSGGINGTVVDIRLILSIALKSASTSVILAHNHPSGNLRPSQYDLTLTSKLKESAKIMDITLIDHLIITEGCFFSFADEGLM